MPMTTQQSDTKESKTSFKIIFGVFLKTGKKRMITSIITGAIIFLGLTTFFMTWYGLRYDSFYTYIDQNHPWNKDENISVFGIEEIYGNYSIENNLLDLAIAESTQKIDKLVPGIRGNYTAGMRLDLYTNSSDNTEILTNDLISLDISSTQTLSSCLTSGRMPENYTEIVFYKKSSNSNVSINDIISFHAFGASSDFSKKTLNCTVVGILQNVREILYSKGVSADFLIQPDDYFFWDPGAKTSDNDQFFSKDFFMDDILNYFPGIISKFVIGVDFDYQISIAHIKNLRKISKDLAKVQYSYDESFDYFPGYYVTFCDDLVNAFGNFERQWMGQTISVFASSLPLLFIFGVIVVEIFNIGSFEQESKFRLLKTHGLEFKMIRKMLILENFITTSSSLITGFSLGLLTGFLVFLKLGISKEVTYIGAVFEPLIVIGTLVLFFGFFIFGLIIQYSHAKKTSETATEQFKSKRRKLMKKIFATSEVMFLNAGMLLTFAGLFGKIIVEFFSYTSAAVNPAIDFLIWFVLVFGILFILTSIFLLISRLLNLMWSAIGNKIWTNTKSYFALTLKHLAIYNKNYQRMVLAMFMLCLGITPGLIIHKSIENHNVLEAKLTVGCSDFVIDDWDITNDVLKANISSIEGVENTTKVSISKMQVITYDDPWSTYSYNIRFYTIHDISEYLQVVNLSIIDDGYSEKDLEKLSTNLTYMMSRSYARAEKLDKKAIFKTTMITSEAYEPYSMELINSFDYFPLLTVVKSSLGNLLFPTKQFDLVIGGTTSGMLLNRTDNSVNTKSYLLINAKQGANITKIKNEINQKFSLTAKTLDDVTTDLNKSVSKYAQIFLVITSIITAIAIFFLGLISAINVYRQRLRIIESEFQLGAQRRQIWGSFTLEVLLIIPIPIAISMAIGIPAINLLTSNVLNITENFKQFKSWMPWWIILIVIAIGVIALMSSWLLKIIPLVKSYKPIKQE